MAADVPNRPMSPDELATWVGSSRRFMKAKSRQDGFVLEKLSPRLVRFMPSDIGAWLANSSTTEVA